MLLQLEPLEEPFHVGRKDLFRRLAIVHHEKHGDQPFDDVRIAVGPKYNFGRLGALDGHEPDLTQTPWNQVLLIPEFLRVRLQLPPKLYEVSIAVL